MVDRTPTEAGAPAQGEFFRKWQDSSLLELLEALRAPGSPAAGAALAYVGAVAAALGEMCLGDRPESEQAQVSRGRFLELARRDAEAYARYLRAPGPERRGALTEATETPLVIAQEARALWELLAPRQAEVAPARALDLAAALDLVRTVARSAARLARFNASTAEPAFLASEERAREMERWAESASPAGGRESR